jgi:integrase
VLTDLDCRTAQCPPDKLRVRLTDSQGLYLECAPTGSKRWFWKHYLGGKEKRLALGRYPEVSLRQARLDRDRARLVHKSGADPVQQRRAERIAARAPVGGTFEQVATEYHAMMSPSWSPSYAGRWIERLRKDLCPYIGALALPQITAPVLLDALRRIERRGALELAHNLKQYAGQVMRYGVQTGRCERNPVPDLKGALAPVRTVHMAAILEPAGVGRLMLAIDGYGGQPTTRAALLLSALTFQRPGNIRAAEWEHVDERAAMWTIPASAMKRTQAGKINGRPHFVPLASQALAVLADVRRLTGQGKYVFPSLGRGQRCMSENAVRCALRTMGYSNDEMTPHGFRAMARTLIAEHMPAISVDVIEAQLAHGKSGPLGMAYDRAEFMAQRRQMMQRWADYLDSLQAAARATA